MLPPVRLIQEDCKFKIFLCYRANSRPAWSTYWDTVLKNIHTVKWLRISASHRALVQSPILVEKEETDQNVTVKLIVVKI